MAFTPGTRAAAARTSIYHGGRLGSGTPWATPGNERLSPGMPM